MKLSPPTQRVAGQNFHRKLIFDAQSNNKDFFSKFEILIFQEKRLKSINMNFDWLAENQIQKRQEPKKKSSEVNVMMTKEKKKIQNSKISKWYILSHFLKRQNWNSCQTLSKKLLQFIELFLASIQKYYWKMFIVHTSQSSNCHLR